MAHYLVHSQTAPRARNMDIQNNSDSIRKQIAQLICQGEHTGVAGIAGAASIAGTARAAGATDTTGDGHEKPEN